MATPTVEKYRLVTRSDFDGLVCAALLKELGMLDEIKFVHPKDVQDGLVEITDRDITTNLPYVPGVRLAFDHHESETLRVTDSPDNHVILPGARSAARVVYDYFGGAERFARVPETLMEAVDKADSALFSREEIQTPSGWILLSFLMDPRTGLGRFRDFRVSNYQLMMMLIDECLDSDVEEILRMPDVAERVSLYSEHADAACVQLLARSTVHGNAVVVDLREDEVIHPTNRFMIYALHPECNMSIHVLWGLKQQNTVLAMGKSIIDRSSRTNVGGLMLSYGGGGHDAAGTCQIGNGEAEQVLGELVERVNADG
ncbi:MAG TPA: exopolyphosphatase [Solirubrobacteraceae bacterium]|nr:exopolyphosphatase [Solirubrobacteraceae bacterium]